MGDAPQASAQTRARAVGFLVALLTLAADQTNKLWLLNGFNIAARQPVRVGPWLDVVLAKNPGVSYSLLSAHTAAGRWGLVAFALVATVLIGVWLWRSASAFTAGALGLILGGALGNAWDRFSYGWVADFYYFHIGAFHWYVFNLADVAIVVGVAMLLLEGLRPARAPASPADERR